MSTLIFIPRFATANFYVDASRPDDTGNGLTPSTAKKFLKSGLALMAGLTGKVCQVAAGTYSNANDLIDASTGSGSGGNYNTLRGATVGSVIVTAGLAPPIATTYLICDGLVWKDVTQKLIKGSFLKFLNCGFKGGPATGNAAGVSAGSNDEAADATNTILFEDCWFYGAGGRYNIVAYQASKILLRRPVFRHDTGWTGASDPEANCAFYNSHDCSCQNPICIDNNLVYSTWQGCLYSIYNSASAGSTFNSVYLGPIVVNSTPSSGPGSTDSAAIRCDGSSSMVQTGLVITDAVLWDTPHGINLSFNGEVDAVIDRYTIGQTARGANGYGMVSGSAGTKAITNGIVVNENNGDFLSLSPTYFDTFNNGTVSSGTGRQTYSPFTNGLTHLPRIDVGSALATAGSTGGVMGTNIQFQYGLPGTQVGESGWNTLTATPLFPLSNETVIKLAMQEDGITRGWAGYVGTLNQYIASFF